MIAIPNNFDGIKTRRFGVEVELTGITRCQVAQAMQSVLHGEIDHYGRAYYIRDEQYRRWSVVYDGSITPYNRGGGLDDEYNRNDYGALMFNVFIELPTRNGHIRKTTIALKYDPQYNKLFLTTIT